METVLNNNYKVKVELSRNVENLFNLIKILRLIGINAYKFPLHINAVLHIHHVQTDIIIKFLSINTKSYEIARM